MEASRNTAKRPFRVAFWSAMHIVPTKVVLAGLALALPLWAFGQTVPVIPPVKQTSDHAGKQHVQTPVWERSGNTLSVTASGRAGAAAPTGNVTLLDGRTRAAGAGVKLTTKPGITAHAKVDEIRWAPLASPCVPGNQTCLNGTPLDGVQRGEVGAGFAGKGIKFGVSLGQSRSDSGTSSVALRQGGLPRVLPADGGADVAAPLWFRNSTETSISARGQVSLAPNTSLNLGASVGRVRFLPGSGLGGDDSVDQTTLSLGVRRGAISGAIVGHMLEPTLPGAALDREQRWSGIDLGISVHLPWRGELNFGTQNVWSSGHTPLLFGPGKDAVDPGRVPYVQYHQDL